MTAAPAPLRIEILDPAREPLDRSSGPADDRNGATVVVVLDTDPASRSRRPTPVHTGPLPRALRALHERALQRGFDGSPRRGSAVRHHVAAAYDDASRRLPDARRTLAARAGGRLEITTPFRPRAGGGREAEAMLSLRWSWPRLPMIVRIEPWWRDRSTVTVELRTRRRLRYPRRYFRSAHAAARAVGDALVGS
jgi:hypothetical protein